jgi:DNA-binding NarL/FixJ family response regulator
MQATAVRNIEEFAWETTGPHATTLVDCWTKLASGELKITSIHMDREQYRLELQKSVREPAPTAGEVAVLTRLVLGEPQKAVAADKHCSLSNVAMVAAKCLHRLGVDCVAHAVPMPIVMMIHASRDHRGWVESTGATLFWHEPGRSTLSLKRPDTNLEQILSPGESEVVRRLLDGLSHAQIAASRGTSARTIANQVARAYCKLGVSGRMELMGRLLVRSGLSSESRDDMQTKRRASSRGRLPRALPTAALTAPHAV